MAENTNTGLTVNAWAEITIKEWVKKAAALGISPDHPLAPERFVHHVIPAANGDPEKIHFMFDYYLYFVDWGVGKGVTIKNRDMLAGIGATNRRPKPWFTDVFYTQVKILTHLMAEKYALKAANVIINQSKYGEEGHVPSPTSSGSVKESLDRHTGAKKITKQQFNENRKKAGW